MDIRKFVLSMYRSNGYLLSDGRKAVFIDPGDVSEEVTDIIEQEGLELTHILITHIHLDHFYGAGALTVKTGAKVFFGADDSFLMPEELKDWESMGYFSPAQPVGMNPMNAGEYEFLGRKCIVMPVPGHTPGSLVYYFPEEKTVFTGDLIFAGSVGRTDFHGGDAEKLMNSIRTCIFTLDDDTVIYSGHGPSTTVGREKKRSFFR